MGHVRLGRLPRTRKWNQVIALLSGGASAREIAAATSNAAEKDMLRASQDPAFVHAFWLLTQIPLHARQQDFGVALRGIGLDVGDRPGLVEIIAAVSDAVDVHARTVGGRTDVGEMAQLSAVESLTAIAGRELPGLFGPTHEEVRAAFAGLATEKQFSVLARDFFSRLTRRYLGYYLSRELSNHVGANARFHSVAASIHGRVSDAENLPLPGVTVKSFRKSLRKETTLGEAMTDRGGKYVIRHRVGKPVTVDLVVRVFDPASPDKALAESPVLLEAKSDLEVDLVVEDRTHRGASEYERLHQKITSLLEGAKVAELTAKQVEYLATKANLDPLHVAYFVRAEQVAEKTSIPAEALYGLFRENLPVDLHGLLAQHPDVRRDALRAAAEANLIPRRFGEKEQVDEAQRRHERAAVDLVLKAPAEPGKTALRELLATAVADPEKQDAFFTAYVGNTGPIDNFWKTLRADPRLRDSVDNVQFTFQLGALAGNHLPLVRELQRMKRENEIASLTDLARFSESKWQSIIRRHDIGMPLDVPGDSSDSKAANYAAAIARMVEDAAPTAFFAARVAESDSHSKQDLATFFAANKDFAINGARLETYIADHPTALDVVAEERRAEVRKRSKARSVSSSLPHDQATSSHFRKPASTRPMPLPAWAGLSSQPGTPAPWAARPRPLRSMNAPSR